MSYDSGDIFIGLIQLLPNKIQWVIAGIIAAALIAFFVYLGYLYFTGDLW